MGPKKMSQAEKDALAAAEEEAERLALEAEVVRLEEERIQREEDERQLRAAQLAFREDEVKELAVEAKAAAAEAADAAARLQADDDAAAAARAWAKVVACDPLPDPSNQSEVNTYISIALEEKPADLAGAVAACALTERVASGVDDVMADADAHGDAEGVARCVDLSLRLRETTVARVDHVTSAVAARPDEFSNGGGDDYGSDASATGIKVSIWANVVPKSFRGAAKAVALKGAGMQVDIPKPINVLKVAMRACHYSFDAHTPTAAAPSDWVVLGGVVTVDFFFLAPPPKTIRAQWTMRQSTVDAVAGLQRMPYGDEHGAAAILAPIKVRYGLPACVHAVPADGERAMLHWDKAAMAWSLEGVEQGSHDLVFHAEAREVQFTTNKSGAFALAQSRVLDMPYASWSMAPALEVQALDSDIDVDKDEEGCVHLSVTTARGRTVLIQVTADCCQLLEPEIAGLHLRKLGPGQLLRALAAAGINLLPTDADAARIGKRIVKRAEAAGGSPDGVVADSVVPKSPELEAAAYASMAALASSFDFESSRWNPKVGRGRAVVQARETSVYTGGNAETLDLKLVLIEEDKHSESYRHCPDVGDIPAPAIKSSLIVQSEALPPPVEEVKAAEPDGVKEAKVEAAAEAEAEAAEPLAEERPKGEVFNETRVAGTKTHVALRTTLQGSSSEEALERVDRASLILCRTLAQVLKLTRPLSFG